MLSNNLDVQGRLRLFRYGLVVVGVLTFALSLLLPYVTTAPYAREINTLALAHAEANNIESPALVEVSIMSFLPLALIITGVTVVVLVAVYFGYRAYLMRSTDSAETTSGPTPATQN